MSLEKTNSALVSAWLAAFPSDVLPTAFPNIAFTPPDSGLYAELAVVSASNSAATLGNEGDDEDIGYMQVVLNDDLGIGTANLNRTLDEIKVAFKNGRGFSYDGQTVIMNSSRTPPSFQLNGRAVQIIQINWLTRTQRIA